jgi:hypothetical protein
MGRGEVVLWALPVQALFEAPEIASLLTTFVADFLRLRLLNLSIGAILPWSAAVGVSAVQGRSA